MKSICHSGIFFHQIFGSVLHLMMLLLVIVSLQICSSYCEKHGVIKWPAYSFYDSVRVATNNQQYPVCIGPFPYGHNYTFCESINCNGMNTSCYKASCAILRTNGLETKVHDRATKQTIYLPINKIVLSLSESQTMLNKADFPACSNDSQKQMDFIKKFIANSTTGLEPSTPTQIPKKDGSNWIFLLVMGSAITVLAFLFTLVLFFVRSKSIKCFKGIDSTQESAIHHYEEITTFPQHPTPYNFYHASPMPTSYDVDSLETNTYSELQTDQTLSINNEPQQEMAYAVIQPRRNKQTDSD